jgi:hypothetical protein
VIVATPFEPTDAVTAFDVRKDPSRPPTELWPGAVRSGNVMLAFHPTRS